MISIFPRFFFPVFSFFYIFALWKFFMFSYEITQIRVTTRAEVWESRSWVWLMARILICAPKVSFLSQLFLLSLRAHKHEVNFFVLLWPILLFVRFSKAGLTSTFRSVSPKSLVFVNFLLPFFFSFFLLPLPHFLIIQLL